VDGITVIKRASVKMPVPVPVVKPLPRTIPEPVEPEPAVPNTTSAPTRRAPSVRSIEVDATSRGARGSVVEANGIPVGIDLDEENIARGEIRDFARIGSHESIVEAEANAIPVRIDLDEENIARGEIRVSARGSIMSNIEADLEAPPPGNIAIEPRNESLYAEAVTIEIDLDEDAVPVYIDIDIEASQKKPRQISPWIGKYAEFRALLDKGDAGDFVQKWHQEDLSNVMALIALGEWYEKTDNTTQAARAYGSLIDYFPARADIRRWAAERLLSIKSTSLLSIDSLKKAVKQRPDHPSGHYLLAIAHWEAGQYKEAVEILQTAIKRKYPRFAAANRILKETLAIMLTRLEQQQQLETLFPGNTFKWEKATKRQLRLVLMWETDANDVDFHIYDNQQHHAYYRQKSLPTGGTLYADITTGYGPECFSISEPKAFPYKVQAHYYRMGPMGYGMGILHVLDYDLKKGLKSEFRPFVVMKNHAFVELGKI
jgi:tetratricopeptide (TPR) repeat protein